MSLFVGKANEYRGSHAGGPALLITTYQERLRVSGAEIQTKTAVVARL
jgi:hypothetical protein